MEEVLFTSVIVDSPVSNIDHFFFFKHLIDHKYIPVDTYGKCSDNVQTELH